MRPLTCPCSAPSLAAALLTLSPGLAAQLEFDAQPVTAAAPDVSDVRAGDLDGDGDLDVVLSDIDAIRWCENLDGQGSFAAPALLVDRVGMSTNLDVAVADLDGDGDLDLAGVAFAPGFSEYAFGWYANDGAGSFGGAHVVTLIYEFSELFELADMDGDGDVDLLHAPFAYYDPREFELWRNDGAGTFTLAGSTDVPMSADTYFTVLALDAGDIDGDGDTDVAFSGERLPFPYFSHDYPIQWLENADGLGNLAPAEILDTVSGSAGPISVLAIADLDADDDADVLVGGPDYDLGWFPHVAATGEFAARETLGLAGIQDVAAADMDHDGDVDVLIAAGTMLWFENIPGPGFAGVADLDATSLVGDRLALADVDGDADLDVVGSSAGLGAVDWFRSGLETLPWTEAGAGLAGGAGLPILAGQGVLSPGQPVSLGVTQAPANAATFLIFGAGQLMAPFKGGTLAPTPDIVVSGLFSDPGGALPIATTWPATTPAGLTLTVQAWFADASGPAGFTATNGVARVTQ